MALLSTGQSSSPSIQPLSFSAIKDRFNPSMPEKAIATHKTPGATASTLSTLQFEGEIKCHDNQQCEDDGRCEYISRPQLGSEVFNDYGLYFPKIRFHYALFLSKIHQRSAT